MIGVYRNLIPQAMDWSRYFPCEIDKSGRFPTLRMGMIALSPNNPPKADKISFFFSGDRNDTYGCGFAIDHPDGHFVSDERRNGSRIYRTWNCDHVQADRATLVIASSFSMQRLPFFTASAST